MVDSPKKHQDMFGAPLPQRGLEEEKKDHEYYSEEKSDTFVTADGDEPTAHEIKSLRHVGEWLPMRIWLIATVELCERFTYYGMSGLFQNYVRNPTDGSIGRAGLGLGHQAATGLTTFFQFWCYGGSDRRNYIHIRYI